MSGIHAALAGILSGGSSVPSDWYFRWEAGTMALGTTAQPWPDASGNGRSAGSQDYGVTDALIGTNRALTKPTGGAPVALSVPSSTGGRTHVFVVKPPSQSLEMFRVALADSTGVLTLNQNGQMVKNGGNVTPQVAIPADTAAVWVFRLNTNVAPFVGNLRTGGVLRSTIGTGGSESAQATSLVRVNPNPSSGTAPATKFALAGMFDRMLSDDEVLALEADLKARYGI